MDRHPRFQYYSRAMRNKAWQARARDAIWGRIPDGKIGDVVVLLRARGRAATKRSSVFFVLLLTSILLGFAYYVGLPFYLRINDAAAQALQETNRQYDRLIQDWDRQRGEVVDAIRIDLQHTGSPVEGLRGWSYIGIEAVDLQGVAIPYLHDNVADPETIEASGLTGTSTEFATDLNIEAVSYSPTANLFAALTNDLRVIVREPDQPWRAIMLDVAEGAEIDAVIAISPAQVMVAYQASEEERQRIDSLERSLFDDLENMPNVSFSDLVTRMNWSRGRYRVAVFDISNAQEIDISDDPPLVGPSEDLQDIELGGRITAFRALPNGLIGIPQRGGYLTIFDPKTGDHKYVSLSTSFDLFDVAATAEGYVIGGAEGYLATLPEDLPGLETLIETPMTGTIRSIAVHAGTQDWWIAGEGNTVYRSSNKGADWTAFLNTGNRNVKDAALVGQSFYTLGENTVVTVFPGNIESPPIPDLPSGSEGDDMLRRYVRDQLPIELSDHPRIQSRLVEFNERVALRPIFERRMDDNAIEIAELRRRGFSYEDRVARSNSFMQGCLPNNSSAEDRQGCRELFEVILANETGDWWEALARNAPPGILLLFLLSTMGGLYRYNLRVAGFYHARADLLELIGEGGSLPEGLTVTELSDILASEKVEFGKTGTPSDQAVDIFKTIASRLPTST